MITLLASLAVVAQVAAAVILAALVASKLGRPGPARALRAVLGQDALRIAWLVAVIALCGSLYFSEVRHFQPCPLCWYQRVCMYPLALVLGIAAFTKDRSVARYVVPLCGIGAAISIYHYQLERFPDQEVIACSTSVPCTTIWFESFGYITIPMMALTAFITIGSLVWLSALESKETSHG